MSKEIRCTWQEVELAYFHFFNKPKPKTLTHAGALQHLCVIYGWEVVEKWLIANAPCRIFYAVVLRSDIDELLTDNSKYKALEARAKDDEN